MTYKEVKADWEYLWSIGPANDMTGGYVYQEDLEKLLKNPTKATAKSCMISQIEYWFQAGIEPKKRGGNIGDSPQIYENKFPRIKEIAKKYNMEY